MTTAGDLCTNALLDSGVIGNGQVPEASDINTAFRLMNGILSQWNRKRWMVCTSTPTWSFVSTGAISYTVGPGGNFNTPRPDRLEDGNFLRQLNTNTGNAVDYPMALLPAREDYNRIRLKSMGTWPDTVFYDSQYPIGNVFFWPVPQASIYELHILSEVTTGAVHQPSAENRVAARIRGGAFLQRSGKAARGLSPAARSGYRGLRAGRQQYDPAGERSGPDDADALEASREEQRSWNVFSDGN